ncbi:hypothetical protein FVE24_04970, partial [Parageobacillus sp. SY1]
WGWWWVFWGRGGFVFPPIFFIWYSIGRFFIEGMRTDSLMLAGHLRIARVVSVALIILSVCLWVFRRVKGLAKERYND